MRMILAAVTTLIIVLASSASTQQGEPTPPQGPESAKLTARYDPTKATVITAADITAAIGRFPAAGVSANGTFIERTDTASRLAYRIAVDRRRTPQYPNAHPTEAEVLAVIDGTGTITTGGKIVETMKDGKLVSPHVIFVSIEFPRPRAPVPVEQR